MSDPLHDKLLKFRPLWKGQSACSFKGKPVYCWGVPADPAMFSGITLSLLTETMAATVSMPPVLKVIYGIFSGGMPALPKMLFV